MVDKSKEETTRFKPNQRRDQEFTTLGSKRKAVFLAAPLLNRNRAKPKNLQAHLKRNPRLLKRYGAGLEPGKARMEAPSVKVW